jgi:hypothetical protein
VTAEDTKKADANANADANADANANANADAKADDDTEAGSATDDVVFDTLWSRVIAAWDDDKPHGALVEYAVRAQKLPELAGKYKAMTAIPEKKERAQKRLDGVVMAATQMLMAMKSPPLPKSNKPLNVIVGLIAAALFVYVAYKIAMSHGAQ